MDFLGFLTLDFLGETGGRTIRGAVELGVTGEKRQLEDWRVESRERKVESSLYKILIETLN